MIALPPQVEHLVNAIYPPARQALADQHAVAVRWLFALNAAASLALALAFYYTGIAARVRARLTGTIKRRWLVTFAFIALMLAGFALLTLPLAWYEGFTLPHAYGLSRELPGQWWRDWTVELAVDIIITGIVGTLFVLAVARFRKRWPYAAALGAAPLIIFGFAIFPAFIAPLFNSYTALPPSPLKDKILALARAQGVNADTVYVFDMSRQSTEGNAYVAGIGHTERIALGDTLLRSMPPDEVMYVFAHELGHYKLHHAWLGALFTWIDVLGAIAVLALFAAARPRTDYADAATLPLVAALLIIYGLVTMPLANAVSRSVEGAADAYAVVHAASPPVSAPPEADVRSFARLGSQNLAPLHPPRLIVWYFYTHPPLDERIMESVTH